MNAIVEYSATEAALADLRGRYAKATFDVATTKGLDEARTARKELRDLRVALEKKRVELKAPVLDRGRLIDDEAKRITTALTELETPIDEQIKTEEARKERERKEREDAERKRISAIHERISAIKMLPFDLVGKPAAAIASARDALTPLIVEDYDEFIDDALVAVAATSDRLTRMHDEAVAVERDAEERRREREELRRQKEEQAAAQRRIDDERRAIEAEKNRIASESLARMRTTEPRSGGEWVDREKRISGPVTLPEPQAPAQAIVGAAVENGLREGADRAFAEQAGIVSIPVAKTTLGEGPDWRVFTLDDLDLFVEVDDGMVLLRYGTALYNAVRDGIRRVETAHERKVA